MAADWLVWLVMSAINFTEARNAIPFLLFSLGPKRSKLIKSSSSYLSKKVFVPGPRLDPDQALSGGRGFQDHKSSKKRTERDCSKSQNQLKIS